VLIGTFIATVAGLCVVVAQIHPDKVSVPTQYEGGLEAELGGPRAVRVSDVRFDDFSYYADRYRPRRLVRKLHGNIERARKEAVYISYRMGNINCFSLRMTDSLPTVLHLGCQVHPVAVYLRDPKQLKADGKSE
jgi:hypothetical protein